MDWSDERYVRLFTRDTPDWLFWSWQSRALFPLLLRKVDRAGVIDLGQRGIKSVAILVGLPVEVAEPGLAGLLDDGCVIVTDNVLVVRNFIEAQETPQSDKARQRESRARRHADAERGVTKRDQPSQNVTECHGASHEVTSGHAASQAVTLDLAVPSCAVPEEPLAPVGADAGAHDAARQEPTARTHDAEPAARLAISDGDTSTSGSAAARRAREAEVTAVLAHWRGAVGMPKAAIEGKAADKRRARIRARLAEGWSATRLCAVADGAARDDWIMGRDPKGRPGGWREVETIYRDNAQCERLEQLAGGGPVAGGTPAPKSVWDVPENSAQRAARLENEQRRREAREREDRMTPEEKAARAVKLAELRARPLMVVPPPPPSNPALDALFAEDA